MSDRRKREIRELMAETGMNYTRAARELERLRSATVQCAIESDKIGSAPDWAAEVQRFVAENARQIAQVQRFVNEHGKQIAEIQRFTNEHGKQIAEVQRFTNEHAKLMAGLGEPGRVLAQMAEVRRAVNRANAFRIRFTPPA